jgi:hypothetical protein
MNTKDNRIVSSKTLNGAEMPGFPEVSKMKISGFRHRLLTAIALLMLLINGSSLAAQASMDQTFVLRPGWNAIYLELDPLEDDIGTIFAGIPVSSVWRWLPQRLGQDFISDPAEGLLSVDGWFGYFPEPRPDAFLTNLFAMSGNLPYLVKLDDTVNHTLTITGVPVTVPLKWRGDSYNLTGLPVEPGNEPSFGDFFETSPAHQDQAIYKLDASGVWQLVSDPFSEVIQSGEAYWIYTKGVSNYQGPLAVFLEQGESLEYSAAFNKIKLTLSNFANVPTVVRIERLNGNSLPMTYLNVDSETGEQAWPDLSLFKTYDLESEEDIFVHLAVTRRRFTEERMEQIFALTNGLGSRILLHAGADTYQPLTLPTAKARYGDHIKAVPPEMAGLWVGQVRIDGVSEAQLGGISPEPTEADFGLRFILHVDSSGTTRLLKDVTQMWQEGTLTADEQNPEFLRTDTPGRYVLLTDETLIPAYTGATTRSGQQVGIRYSTVAYDFEDETLDFIGDFGIGSTIGVTVSIPTSLPTNPFLHRYHPDHDNLDAQFLNPRLEAFDVNRDMEFQFDEHNRFYPDVADPPDWGNTTMGGIFRETITGLHKNAIFVSGTFRMSRVAATPVLNQ